MDGVSQCVLVVVSRLIPPSLMAFHMEVYIRPDTVSDSLMMSVRCLVIYMYVSVSLSLFADVLELYVIRTDVVHNDLQTAINRLIR